MHHTYHTFLLLILALWRCPLCVSLACFCMLSPVVLLPSSSVRIGFVWQVYFYPSVFRFCTVFLMRSAFVLVCLRAFFFLSFTDCLLHASTPRPRPGRDLTEGSHPSECAGVTRVNSQDLLESVHIFKQCAHGCVHVCVWSVLQRLFTQQLVHCLLHGLWMTHTS